MYGQFTNGFIYIGPREWRDNVEKKVTLLPEDQARVPMDGHYGRGQNRIIGDYLAAVLRDRHVRLVQ